MVDMVPVESSNLAAVGFDVDTKVLTVRFLSGSSWDYAAVPAEKHTGLMGATSKGGYFAQHIRPVYTATKHTEPPPSQDEESAISRL